MVFKPTFDFKRFLTPKYSNSFSLASTILRGFLSHWSAERGSVSLNNAGNVTQGKVYAGPSSALLAVPRSVCQVPVAEGKSVQQTVDMLHKKLEQLGAVKQGSFCVDCETYHATGNSSSNNFLSVCFWALEFRFIDHINALTHEGDLMSMSRWGCRVFYPLFVWLFAKKKKIASIWTVVNDLLAYNLSNRSLTNDSESFWVRKNISITKQNLFFGKVIFISPLFMQLSVTDIKKNSREIWQRGQEKLWQI